MRLSLGLRLFELDRGTPALRNDAVGPVTSVIKAFAEAVHGHEGDVMGLVHRTETHDVHDAVEDAASGLPGAGVGRHRG